MGFVIRWSEFTAMSRIPLIHITDLYHPAQDPDDQFDLATVLALPELELRAVLLDVTERFLVAAPQGWDVAREPGHVLVEHAARLSGREIPVAVGPAIPLADLKPSPSVSDSGSDGAVAMLLKILGEENEKIAVSVVGSARILAAAWLRNPDLMRTKVSAIWVNAGSTVDRELEWNVGLDPVAYRAMWQSGIPINWFPCATEQGAFDPEPERGTHWSATHAELLTGLDERWRGWFAFGLSGSARSDVTSAMAELATGETWQALQHDRRSMWSTTSLVMAAGRRLALTNRGWRFVGASEVERHRLDVWPWRMDPIEVRVRQDAHVDWTLTSANFAHRLFGRRPGSDYGRAMKEALNALLQDGLPGGSR